MINRSLAGIAIRNTRDVINEHTKICMLMFAPPKFGKTTAGESLDRMTKKFFGKPSLFIAVEPGEGGGTMSIADKDVDYIVPQNFNDFGKILSALHSDTTYGGVILDSASEYVNRYLKPYSLAMPNVKEKSVQRDAGVPGRSDYQTMGEQARIHFNQLIALTTHADLNIRKHLLVTALEREKYDADGKVLVAIQPDLPGAMAGAATAMFQTVGSVKIVHRVVPDPANPKATTRAAERQLITNADGVRIAGDRTKIFPNPAPLDFCEIWERYWLPEIEKRRAA
jgi:hypothetical protein